MPAETAPPQTEKIAQQPKAAAWWCNFCDFSTDDQATYLAHSCTEELEKRGVKVEATGQNECR